MPTAHDAAAYILSRTGPIPAMKLQKLAYYSQAWSLVWDDVPLFPERIEAWVNGPVVPALYFCHQGQFQVETWTRGNPEALDKDQIETIEQVLKFYGNHTSQWLSELTHNEKPWKDARRGLAPSQRGNVEITHAAMADYYGNLS